MASFRLSRPLMGILALSYLSMSASFIGFSTFIVSNTSMAQGFVTAAATACSTPSGHLETVAGMLQSIHGQNLTIVDIQKHLSSRATYSNTTYIRQNTFVPTDKLKSGMKVMVLATTTVNSTTYTASMVTLPPQDDPCFAPPAPPKAGDQPPCTQNGSHLSCEIRGTIQKLKGSILTVKDDQAKNYSITLTSTVKPLQVALVKPAEVLQVLKPNTFVSVIGSKTNEGITAWSILILGTSSAV